MPDGDPGSFTRVTYGCEANEVAETLLMTPFNRNLEALKSRAENVGELNGFYRGFTAYLEDREVSAFNSMIGSPSAGDCTYFLRFTPCRNIIYTGSIGALQQQMRIGDLIVPTAALRGEGTSRYFVDEAYPAVADFTLLRAIATTLEEVYADSESAIHIGAIYTTDSFAAETKEFLRHWKSRNLLGIEMETSVIYTIAGLYGMRAAAIHIVSDNPVAKKSLFHSIPVEDKNRRRACEDLLIEALVRLITRI